MASKLTKDGLILPDTGTFQQEKTVISVEGVEADNQGRIVLSSEQGKTLDERITDIDNRLSSVESGPSNIFLDSSLIVIQSQEITDWTYGPNNNETYPVVNHIVPEFENFFDNHLDKHKLSIHTGDGYTEVLVDDLKAFFDTPNELSTTLGAPVNQQEVFNNWYRFSHWDGISRGSGGVGNAGQFPANYSDTLAWEYKEQSGDIVCTKNTDTLTGFVSQQKYEDYFYQTTLSSTSIDNDIIAVVLAFVIDPDGTEHTITAVRLTSYQFNLVLDAGQYAYNDLVAASHNAQMTAYTPTTSWLGTPSAWALVYNLGQSNAKVLVNGDSTAPALWVGDTTQNYSRTTGDDTLYGWGDGDSDNSIDDGTSVHTTVVRVRRQGNGFEAWCSQWNQSDIDGTTKLTLDLDSDPDLLRFKGKQSYGVSSMSQESARFSNQKFAETEFTFWYDSSDNDNRNVFQLRNNDLILKQYSPYAGSEHFKVYRIDLHPRSTDSNSSIGTVKSVNQFLPDNNGNVTIPTGTGGNGAPNWSTGWVSQDYTGTVVDDNATLSFAHNLDNNELIYQVFVADDINGTNSCAVDFQFDFGNNNSDQIGSQITNMTNNSFQVRLGDGYVSTISPTGSSTPFSGKLIKVVVNSSSGYSYTDADVDNHLNQPSATSGQVLSWNGSDYEWSSSTIGSLKLLSTPVIFQNLGPYTTLQDLPIAKKSDGVTNSPWQRLSYSAISSEIPDGSVLYCRVICAGGGYTPNSRFYINNDVSGSTDQAVDHWEHAFLISYDAGASAGGGNFGGASHSVTEGYFITEKGITPSTNSVLLHYYNVQKLIVLGYAKMF